jgi:hypothetical protein
MKDDEPLFQKDSWKVSLAHIDRKKGLNPDQS